MHCSNYIDEMFKQYIWKCTAIYDQLHNTSTAVNLLANLHSMIFCMLRVLFFLVYTYIRILLQA